MQLCARVRDGAVRCLGPEGWTVVPGIRAVGLAAGSDAMCAWTAEHDLWCWGGPFSGEGAVWPPRLFPTPGGFERVGVGDNHVC
jgi:hypothetical protein